MSFGDNLKKYREKAGLSQSALGAKMGLQGSIIGRYELGVSTPKPDRILEFAYALGVDTNALLGYEEPDINEMEYAYKCLKDFNNLTENEGRITYRLLTNDELERMNITQPKSSPKNTKVLPTSVFLSYVKKAREQAKVLSSFHAEKYENDSFIAILNLILQTYNDKENK